MTRAAAAALVLLALAGCAAPTTADRGDRARADAAELADTLKGRTAGAPLRCINASNLEAPQIIGETLVYRQGSRLFVTRPEGGCAPLAGDPLIVTDLYGSNLCRNDRFRVIPRGTTIPGPYCRFGDFTPYTLPK